MKIFFGSRAVNTVTVICLLTVILCLNEFYIGNPEYAFNGVKDDPGRNENSTPRTFILPATPAVAREQERKKKLIKRHDEIMRCIFALNKANFISLDKLDDIFDIRVTVALIKYQSANNLNITAEFDSDTKKKLECT